MIRYLKTNIKKAIWKLMEERMETLENNLKAWSQSETDARLKAVKENLEWRESVNKHSQQVDAYLKGFNEILEKKL